MVVSIYSGVLDIEKGVPDEMASFQFRMADGEQVTCRVTRIMTHHETLLDLDPATRLLSHRPEEFSRETVVVTWSLMPGFALLIGSDGTWPEAPSATCPNGWSPVFLPLSVIAMPEEKWALKRYRNSFFARAEDGTGRVYFDGQLISDWERYQLLSIDTVPSVCLRDFAAAFAELVKGREDPPAVLKALAACPPSFLPHLLDMMCDFLAPGILDVFARLFIADLKAGTESVASLCSRILSTLPQGGWISEGFQRLHEWQSGKLLSVQAAGASYDFLGFQENIGKDAVYCIGARLLSVARRAISPTKTLALLATARDEGVYLLEWIAHHRRIGVEQFFIYTNDLTDGSDRLLYHLAQAGEIIWIDNSGAAPERINMQDKAYNHALMILPEILDYRWCLVVDLDEVVLPSKEVDHRLPPLLEAREREGAEAVTMSWRVLTSNRHLAWTPALSAERFVETEKHVLLKTAFRTNLFSGASAHHPVSRERDIIPYMTIDGEQHKNGDLTNYDINFSAHPTNNAFICHYHVRSLEEYVWKFARGENDGTGVLKKKHFRYNNPGIFELFVTRFDLDGPQPARILLEDIQYGIRRLLRLPGVAEAQAEVEHHFRSQSSAYVEQSLEIMTQDDRIASDVKDKWRILVDAWRQLSR
ncbi:glycosyltransferase family 2 protein [Asaia prunellae]|uniref:glycosyltransferase family 2 protein n=1 Tax=Asaia prunellae TaxID=610245 RepID=UPI000472C941|nr:glycosyltransferase family 2 protein [Asaia prunellae]